MDKENNTYTNTLRRNITTAKKKNEECKNELKKHRYVYICKNVDDKKNTATTTTERANEPKSETQLLYIY